MTHFVLFMPKFRLDRSVTLGVHRVSRLLDGCRQLRIPILMYHGIREEVGKRHPYFETNTSPQLFASHMRLLRDSGYTTVRLSDAVATIAAGRPCRRRVAITFDDGYRDFYTHAFPILNDYGFKATMFIVSGFTAWRPLRRDEIEYMTWDEVREIHSYGIEIGSHTVTHPELQRMSHEQVDYEIRQSKLAIEEEIGQSIRSFSYPFAFPEPDREFVGVLKGLLEARGYENGVSTVIGTAGRYHDRFFMPRLPVNSFDDLRFFQAKLEGAYDWLHTAQVFYKRLLKPTVPTSARSEIAVHS